MLNEVERIHQENLFAERAWLEYFNRYLYARNVISEKEYKLMVDKIASRRVCSSRHKSSV